jgi:cytochrome c oxidase subunit 2
MKLFPENISTYGHEIDNLFYFITIPVGLAFIVTMAVFIYPLIRNRFRPDRKAAYIKGNTMKQLKWVLVSMALIGISDIVILLVEKDAWHSIEQELPEEDFKVAITGRQWSWTITYPGKDGKLYTADDVNRTNELHVPVNGVVHLDIKSLDVLHSVFIPNVRLKQDALPGRTITRWFEATKTGTYDISCAEICGVAHSNMKGTLYVDSRKDFLKYLDGIYQ